MSRLNKEVARIYIERFTAGDAEGVLDLLADDVQYFVTGKLEPLGKKDVEATIVAMDAAFHAKKSKVQRQVAEADWVATAFAFTGTHAGNFQGLAATGRSFSVHAMSHVRVRDGKIIEIHGLMDALGLVRAIGATLRPGTT